VSYSRLQLRILNRLVYSKGIPSSPPIWCCRSTSRRFRLYYIYIVILLLLYSFSMPPSRASSVPARILELNEFDDLLNRVGSSKGVYEWSTRTNDDFEEWHRRTTFYKEQMELPRKARRIPLWGKDRAAAGWQYFHEGADRITGIPMIICQRCSASMKHPKFHGTSAMTSHPHSDKCKKTAKARGLTQAILEEGFQESVQPETQPGLLTSLTSFYSCDASGTSWLVVALLQLIELISRNNLSEPLLG